MVYYIFFVYHCTLKIKINLKLGCVLENRCSFKESDNFRLINKNETYSINRFTLQQS